MAPGTEGGVTRHLPSGDVMPIYEAAMRYQEDGVPLVVVGGKEYGTGSSRDWAAKGTRLLGVKAVIVESFERIHRSNLIGMGLMPLQFKDGQTRKTLKLDGTETWDITGLEDGIKQGMDVKAKITRADGSSDDGRESGRYEIRHRLHEKIDLPAETDGGERLGSKTADHHEVGKAYEGLGAEADDRRPGQRPDAEGGYVRSVVGGRCGRAAAKTCGVVRGHGRSRRAPANRVVNRLEIVSVILFDRLVNRADGVCIARVRNLSAWTAPRRHPATPVCGTRARADRGGHDLHDYPLFRRFH